MGDERLFTETELQRYSCDHGSPRYVAHAGVVCEVTDSPKWRSAMHEPLHFAGRDLASQLPDAPHCEEVFARPCVIRAGRPVSSAR